MGLKDTINIHKLTYNSLLPHWDDKKFTMKLGTEWNHNTQMKLTSEFFLPPTHWDLSTNELENKIISEGFELVIKICKWGKVTPLKKFRTPPPPPQKGAEWKVFLLPCSAPEGWPAVSELCWPQPRPLSRGPHFYSIFSRLNKSLMTVCVGHHPGHYPVGHIFILTFQSWTRA